MTKLFPQGFESILPYAKEVSRSINLGMPVMAASPDAEISRLGAAGTAVAHCATSNMRLASGTARVLELEEEGVPVGLGVDGSA